MLTVVEKPTLPQSAPTPVRFARRFPHGTVAEHFRQALREQVGRHGMSRQHLAGTVGVSASAIDQFLSESDPRTPGLHTYHAILAALGPSFTNRMLELSGQTGARRINHEAHAASAVLADLTMQAAEIARDLADGRLDHQERAALRKSLPPLIAKLQEFAAQLGAG